MLVTEEIARTATCVGDTLAKCSASRCLMGWRWWGSAEIEIRVTKTAEPPAGEGWMMRSDAKGKAVKSWSWGRPWGNNRRGYCGLAGKPDAPWNTDAVPVEREA